jgi:trehalose 6-phosphate phosphatase
VSAPRVSRAAPDEPRPALPPSSEGAARLSRSPLLIGLDIDGTLAPIAPTPSEAAVPAATRRALERLAALPNVHVALVTGRAARNGQEMVNVAKTWTIGNHGFELIDPAGALRVNPAAEPYARVIRDAVDVLHAAVGRFDGVFVEDKSWTASIHYRLAKPADVPKVEQMVADAARRFGLWTLQGKKIFELRPPLAINKGTALLQLANDLDVVRAGRLGGSLLYAGDDRTDEDAFRIARGLTSDAVTIHIGTAELPDRERTVAELLLADTTAVREYLEWLVSVREQTPAHA